MSEAWRAVLSLHGDDDLGDDDLGGVGLGEGDPPAETVIVRRDLGGRAGRGDVEADGVAPARGGADAGRRT